MNTPIISQANSDVVFKDVIYNASESDRKCLSLNIAFHLLSNRMSLEETCFAFHLLSFTYQNLDQSDLLAMHVAIPEYSAPVIAIALECLKRQLHPFDGEIEVFVDDALNNGLASDPEFYGCNSGDAKLLSASTLKVVRDAMFDLGIVYMTNFDEYQEWSIAFFEGGIYGCDFMTETLVIRKCVDNKVELSYLYRIEDQTFEKVKSFVDYESAFKYVRNMRVMANKENILRQEQVVKATEKLMLDMIFLK